MKGKNNKMIKPKQLHLIMPMGGRGSRFFEDGFEIPKPLIKINKKPFFYWATQSVANFVDVKEITFIVLQEHIRDFHIDDEIRKYYPDSRLIVIPQVLAGAVLTCWEGVKSIEDDAPVLFNDCDHLFVCNEFNQFCKHEFADSPDGAVLTFQSEEPKFSFLRYDENGVVAGTVEKQVCSSDAICGAYYFQSRAVFERAAKEYLEKCTYSEFFVSGLYNVILDNGGTVKGFPTDIHITFGTPEEYSVAKSMDGFERVE